MLLTCSNMTLVVEWKLKPLTLTVTLPIATYGTNLRLTWTLAVTNPKYVIPFLVLCMKINDSVCINRESNFQK